MELEVVWNVEVNDTTDNHEKFKLETEQAKSAVTVTKTTTIDFDDVAPLADEHQLVIEAGAVNSTVCGDNLEETWQYDGANWNPVP